MAPLVHGVPLDLARVCLCMVIPAYTFKVIPIESDVRIAYVVRCDVYLVMHNLRTRDDSILETPLA